MTGTPTYSSEFLKAIAIVLKHEGVHSDDPDDSGLDTWYGLARADHPDLEPWPPTIDTARERYWTHYWMGPRIDLLPPCLQPKVFDILVNMGEEEAIKCLQRALVTLGHCEIVIDGELGAVTASICREIVAEGGANWILGEFRHETARRYLDIAAREQRDRKFIKGWLNRAFE
jgi:lysozyme family protein